MFDGILSTTIIIIAEIINIFGTNVDYEHTSLDYGKNITVNNIIQYIGKKLCAATRGSRTKVFSTGDLKNG